MAGPRPARIGEYHQTRIRQFAAEGISVIDMAERLSLKVMSVRQLCKRLGIDVKPIRNREKRN